MRSKLYNNCTNKYSSKHNKMMNEYSKHERKEIKLNSIKTYGCVNAKHYPKTKKKQN